MKNILVTGGTGFIGYHFLIEATKNKTNVYAVCRENSENLQRINQIRGVSIIECDLENIDEIFDKVKGISFDAMYHLAWRGASGKERFDSVIQVENVKWVVQLINLAYKLSIKKIVITGTVCEQQCEEIIQSDYCGKSVYYLLGKKHAYEVGKKMCDYYNIKLVWCTFYHPFGKYNKPEQLIRNTIEKLLKNENARFGPADKWFDVISVEDLSKALYIAGERYLSQDRYFIGSGKPRILREYLLELKRLLKSESDLEFGFYPDDGLPMERQWLLDRNFEEETGWRAVEEFECMINKFINDEE